MLGAFKEKYQNNASNRSQFQPFRVFRSKLGWTVPIASFSKLIALSRTILIANNGTLTNTVLNTESIHVGTTN